MTNTTINTNYESLILHELIENQILRFEANLYLEDQCSMDTTYDKVIFSLSTILAKYYDVPLIYLSDFIDYKIYQEVKNGYFIYSINPVVVDMFIFELGQKIEFEVWFDNYVG